MSAVPTFEANRAPGSGAGEKRMRRKQSFFVVLGAIALSLTLVGGLGFAYLKASSPLSLLTGSKRPIAAATMFVPSRAPFTISLLAKPDQLMALQQAVVGAGQREQARAEVAQIQQTLLQTTGLDYERDIQPWMGEEVTYAYTDVDLDKEAANGRQPGYFVAVEIAPDRQPEAQSFLQLFWQQRSLSGDVLKSEQVNGVRVISVEPVPNTSVSKAAISSATALVGDQFVMFSNDVRVIRRSLHAAQTTQNLAQNFAYRQAVDALPPQRIALAYFDTALLGKADLAESGSGISSDNERDSEVSSSALAPPTFTAVSIGLTRTGITADLKVAETAMQQRPQPGKRAGQIDLPDNAAPDSAVLEASLSDALRYLPASSEVAVVGQSLSMLLSSDTVSPLLPDFLHLGESLSENPWQQLTGDYALAQMSGRRASSRDWILALRRGAETEKRVRSLDKAALKAGYSVVPVSLVESGGSAAVSDLPTEAAVDEATAWTRFKVGRRRQSASDLETELLGFHLQRGNYEIFANSLEAVNSAISAPMAPLQKSHRFLQAISPLEGSTGAYVYLDWPIIAPAIGQQLPAVGKIDRAMRPLSSHIQAVAATRDEDTAHVFIQLKEMASSSVGK